MGQLQALLVCRIDVNVILLIGIVKPNGIMMVDFAYLDCVRLWYQGLRRKPQRGDTIEALSGHTGVGA